MFDLSRYFHGFPKEKKWIHNDKKEQGKKEQGQRILGKLKNIYVDNRSENCETYG